MPTMPEGTPSKSHFLQVLQHERRELEALVQSVPAERQVIAGVVADWSVKDLLAHLLLWEKWVLDRATELRLAGQVSTDERDTRPTDEMNAIHYERYRSTSLADIRGEERRVFEAIVKLVEEFDEEALFTPDHFDFAPGIALSQEIANETIGHFRAHRDELAAFAKASAT
jgi:hypothetical protein